MTPRTRLRRFLFGLASLTGLARRGFFIPYRYAGSVHQAGHRPEAIAASQTFAEAEQVFLDRLVEIEALAADLGRIADAPAPAPRWAQAWFPPLDACVAYAIARTRKPRRIVEVGSGHSTRFLARAIGDGGLKTTITAIDPAPRASLAGLAAGGQPVEWRRGTVQEAGQGAFSGLAGGDILFIDSSHILMPGSDVDLLFNHVLPALPKGTLVHIHDVFLPDDYPAEWDWRGYNEQLAIVPMLVGGGWKTLFASHYAETRLAPALAKSLVADLPNPEAAPASSLWLEKA
ncbi:MAG: class I SAM-dependent methyltransferase [Alphaproteobacteria bacterium]